MEIIPAIDIIGGQCVRLSKGDYDSKKVYNANPLEVAKQFEDAGIRRLHLVDLDGAKAGHIVNARTLENIATHTSLTVDFGGGLKTTQDLDTAFNAGAAMVTGGSIAIKNPAEFTGWIEKYTGERIILGADAKNGKIAVTGWLEDTDADLLPYIKGYMEKGITKAICTDISKDGMLQGANTTLYRQILAECPGLHLIASGGVSSFDDLVELQEAGLPAAIVGKAIYEGRVTLKQLSEFL